jgi:AcrR family transcriptional regulator
MATTEAGAQAAAVQRAQRADARRNRERIVAAAREAFAEHGPDAQMDDVARRARVGVGTVYRHFATKDALVGELIRLKLSDFAARAHAGLDEDGDPWETLAQVLRDQAEVMATDAANQRMTFASSQETVDHAQPAIDELQDAMNELLRRAKDSGALREDVTVADIRTLMCGLGSMMAADRLSVMGYDWRRALEFMLDGMRAR